MQSLYKRLINGALRRCEFLINYWRITRAIQEIDKYSNENNGTGKSVVFFNASTRLIGVSQNSAFSFLTALSLKLQGVEIIQFVCKSGMKKCVLGTDISNLNTAPPCRGCIRQSKTLYKGFTPYWFEFDVDNDLENALKNLTLKQLELFEYEGFPLGEVVLPSLRWILRRHHLNDYANIHQLYREYILSAWNVRQKFVKLLSEKKPKAVILFNGMFYPEAVAKLTAQEFNIPVYSHEVSLQPLSAYFTDGEATAYPIDIPDDFQLNDEQNNKLDNYLMQRFEGNFTMAGIQFWPEIKGLGNDVEERISRYEQIVPVFTNVIFDTSQKHANVIFDHMFEWLDRVVDLIETYPETLFIIRAHPDELRDGKASHENVAAWVEKRNINKYENVIFINADEYISSYDLIRRAKFVMVYNSTIGLEASIMGAAVLCAGKARFTQLPTVFYPNDRDDFVRLAKSMITSENIDVPEMYKNNARRFLYYQLYVSSLPFNRYLKNSQVWNGYVILKKFLWKDLLPDDSRTIKTLSHGILHDEGFLLDHET